MKKYTEEEFNGAVIGALFFALFLIVGSAIAIAAPNWLARACGVAMLWFLLFIFIVAAGNK